MTTDTSPRVSYVVSRWGEPTQTFVRREAAAVAARGFEVGAVSIKQPGAMGGGVPTRWLPPAKVLLGVARAFARCPIRCSKLVLALLTHSAPRNLVRHLPASAIGMAWFASGTIEPGAVHAHFGWTNATALWAWSTLSGRDFSIVVHAFELHTASHLDRFTPLPLRAASSVFTISVRDGELVRTRWGIHSTVLRMGIPDSVAAESPQPFEERKARSIVSVGSLLPKKGHDVLLAAMAQLDSSWHLTIIGSGPEELDLRDRVGELDVGDRVEFAGRLTEQQVLDHLDSATCFALACIDTAGGDRDGIPVALMEAMSRGTPVVSTDAGAIEELLSNAGITVAQRDPTALAAAIDSLTNVDRWTEASRSGSIKIRDEFSIEKALDQLLPTLHEMTEARPSEPDTRTQ